LAWDNSEETFFSISRVNPWGLGFGCWFPAHPLPGFFFCQDGTTDTHRGNCLPVFHVIIGLVTGPTEGDTFPQNNLGLRSFCASEHFRWGPVTFSGDHRFCLHVQALGLLSKQLGKPRTFFSFFTPPPGSFICIMPNGDRAPYPVSQPLFSFVSGAGALALFDVNCRFLFWLCLPPGFLLFQMAGMNLDGPFPKRLGSPVP